MTAATETQAPAPAGARLGRRAWIAIIAAAAVAVGMIVTLAVLGSQIAALRGDVAATAQTQAKTAQAKADAASSAAQAAGKTRSAADNANLGVCVSVDYGQAGYVQSTVITSPTVSAGGAVSCQVGSFTPVTPQKMPAG
jgi:hypothetical protein